MVINFDNSATSYPKPKQVLKLANYAILKCGGNAGRGGHRLSMVSSEQVYLTREALARFFQAKAENVVFTQNCTHSLNTAIFGTLNRGDHVVISSLEHNSVAKPIHHLAQEGYITYSIFDVAPKDSETLENFKSALKPSTRLVVTTIGSNVTGQILPFRQIGELCQRKGICYVADGSQGCGVVPISLEGDHINVLCSSGHKSLYGVSSSGILISDGKYPIRPLTFGGTGSTSIDLNQPNFLPDSLESGTLNTVGIVSLRGGIEYIDGIGIDNVYTHESRLCEILLQGLKSIPNVVVYRNDISHYLPIVSFNFKDVPSNVVGDYLNTKGFCVRSGFHCSALAHKYLNTTTGTVRFSPSTFNTPKEVHNFVKVLRNFDYNKKN